MHVVKHQLKAEYRKPVELETGNVNPCHESRVHIKRQAMRQPW